jgi:5-methylcytosine-specific restriction protein B
MKVKTWDDLCDVFRDSIIPLLQEYFYNDWEKISLVLGESDIFNKSENEKFLLKNKITSQKLFGNDFSDEDRDLYELNKNLTSKKYENLSEQFFIKGFQVSS